MHDTYVLPCSKGLLSEPITIASHLLCGGVMDAVGCAPVGAKALGETTKCSLHKGTALIAFTLCAEATCTCLTHSTQPSPNQFLLTLCSSSCGSYSKVYTLIIIVCVREGYVTVHIHYSALVQYMKIAVVVCIAK